ncbi:MAG: BtpA/SgcQ family protein [Phycisphaerales bacterium]|nr:BtpA/SgcQ family protein [Planctomycetota bacterium]MCH8507848.1 BtpA/SgcQ family protein [Phycisphaerales bacterium]
MTDTAWNLTARGPKKHIGMVHLGASPGTPFARHTPDEIVRQAVAEAGMLAGAGFDGIILENMHDAPYVHGEELGPEVVAVMARTLAAVRAATPVPIGVQILSGGNRAALACAHACGGSFIRCENFVFSHVADEGLLAKAEAGGLLRYRRAIGAEGIPVYCDIKKKHASHAVTSDLDLGEVAEAAAFFGADGVIVTGSATGKPAAVADVRAVREACDLPVLVGSGVTPESAPSLLAHADALIVGSWIKVDGSWKNPVDAERAAEMVRAFRGS